MTSKFLTPSHSYDYICLDFENKKKPVQGPVFKQKQIINPINEFESFFWVGEALLYASVR